MKKCETFEDLQALGTEKLHERTHITRDKVESILTKSYGNIGKVQFMGFISILEREYGIDLTEIRQEFTQFQNEHEKSLPSKSSVVLQHASTSRQKWITIGIGLIGVLIGGGYLIQTVISNEPKEEVMKLSTIEVEVVPEIADSNLTLPVELNGSDAAVDHNISIEAAEANVAATAGSDLITAEKMLLIHPLYKVWVGMIDRTTGEKSQKITSDPIVVDTAKNWLIILGHGRVEIESSAGKKLLKEKETVWFLYEKGALTQLTKDEFVQYNEGKNW